MLKRREEVEILLKAGHRKTEVARLTGVSLCSVKRIAQEGPVGHVDDAREHAETTDRPAQHGREFPETGRSRSCRKSRI